MDHRLEHVFRTTKTRPHDSDENQFFGEPMNDSVFVAVSRGTGNPNRSTRAIHLPSLDRKQGRKTTFLSVDKHICPARKSRDVRLRDIDGNITPGLLIHLKESRSPIMNSQSTSKRQLAQAGDSFVELWTGTAVRLREMGRSSIVGFL